MPAGTGSKKKIRDLKRLIQKANGDEEKIATLKAKIQEVEQESVLRSEQEKCRKHENKYHLVKFVERKKLTRAIQRALKSIDNSESDEERTRHQNTLDSLKDDLTYVMYYPVDMKYIALFARQEKTDQDNSEDHEESRYVMNDKEKTLSNRARQLARAAREQDRNNGKDRVEHAIEVHLNGSKNKKKRKAEHSSNENERLDDGLLEAFKRKADSDEENTDNQKPSSLAVLRSISNRVGDKGKSNASTGSIGATASTSNPSNTTQKQKKPKLELSPTSSSTSKTLAPPEADAFFVEEMAEAIGATDKPSLPIRDSRIARRDLHHRVKAAVNHKKHRIHKNLQSKNPNQVRQFSS